MPNNRPKPSKILTLKGFTKRTKHHRSMPAKQRQEKEKNEDRKAVRYHLFQLV